MTSYLWRLGLAAYKMHPGIAQHITQMMTMTMQKNTNTPTTAPTRMPMISSKKKCVGKVMKKKSVRFKLARPIIMNSTYMKSVGKCLIIMGWP